MENLVTAILAVRASGFEVFSPADVVMICVIGVCLAIVCLALATGLLYLWVNVRWTDFE